MATAVKSDTKVDSAVEEDHAHHPTEKDYVRIALILAGFTAAEISTYYVDFKQATTPLLVILMVIKFAMVAGEFMHLKYDTNVYRRFMLGGLILAILIYAAVLFTFVGVAR